MQVSLKRLQILYGLVAIILLLSCDNSSRYNPNMLKPNAKKNYGELLFALEKKYWKSNLGISIKKSFETLIKTTPLPYEKEFEIDFIIPKKIIKNIKVKNCILFIDIANYNPSKTTPIFKNDLWAKGQLIIELKFNSEESAVNYFKNNTERLKQSINEFYFDQISKKYSTKNIINSTIQSEMELSFKAPKGFKLNKKSQNFWWFSNLTIKKDQNGSHEIQKGIVIYKYPYSNQKQFQKQKQIRLRDSIFKIYLRGKNKDSYMITNLNGLNETKSKAQTVNNKYIKRLSGCWRMINDKMGGSFISISRLSKDKKQIITVEGYVYAPNFEKLKLLRELETIIYSSFWK